MDFGKVRILSQVMTCSSVSTCKGEHTKASLPSPRESLRCTYFSHSWAGSKSSQNFLYVIPVALNFFNFPSEDLLL